MWMGRQLRKTENEDPLPWVDVLLATYNGATYLDEQLESLWAQTYRNFRLLVSDDGSTDATMAILEKFAQRCGQKRFKWVVNPNLGSGPIRNFQALMQASAADGTARWIAFCDQDDVWMPQKLERLTEAMKEAEASDATHPCLVHSDLRVVDGSLRTITDSFVSQQRMDPGSASQSLLLSVNHVTGCAMMINRALLELALPLPSEALMHDWWCALLSGAGRRQFIDEPLVLYRQHGSNQVGANSRALVARMRRLARDPRATLRRIRELGFQTTHQADALARRLAEAGLDDSAARRYVSWRQLPLWRRAFTYGCYYRGPTLDNWCRLLFW